MRVIITGAGQVGASIAASLAADHDVIVIDIDGERVEELTYSLDVLAIKGDGTSLSTLKEAGIETADLFIASTNNDETNVVACATATAVSDPFTIARVKQTNYLETWNQTGNTFGVDFMVCTDLLTAETIVRVIGLPSSQNVDIFAGGRILMAEFRVPSGSPVAGQTVKNADNFIELTFVGILRGDSVIIPTGDTVIEAGDDLVVIGSPESTHAFAGVLSPDHTEDQDIVIVGGSQTGVQTARLLEDRDRHPRLIENDHERARELAEELVGTTVMESDATDREFLDREHVGDADVVIATLGSDEKNLLASLLAERLGVDRTITVVETTEYTDLFEAVGVGAAINPRDATAEEIIRFTHGTENVALVEHGCAEVLEIEVSPGSILENRSISESMADLPTQVVVGAITRNGSVITPRGDTVIESGDHVVLFAETAAVETVAKMV
ncbi:Trk system potassium transporter TrkA [Halocatena pleomorpha]|uniref:Trk system potassium transporter TrkA n=1 Tax=Halocatena pleomorpha TaxID=1785090 RepID=A0A3P3RLA8_9EURY|nr:Trk system potassium transporter TrkA [Halocatena pleomorpha]RRJ33678.1 Trk system potassium transporter TrkA [Halocatena pleomorpha]